MTDWNDPTDPLHLGQRGYVWQPWAMGGGEWVIPKTVRLLDYDIERIAQTVIELLKENSK